MRFVETPVFTKRVKSLLPDEDYRTLQIALMLRPVQGPLIKGGGGLRKVRCAPKGVGKRAKTAQEDLTTDQLRVLARIVREEFK